MNAVYLDLSQAFLNAGLTPPDHILVDGKLHRFAQPDKPKSVSSWYVFFDSGNSVAGAIGAPAYVQTYRHGPVNQPHKPILMQRKQ